MFRKSGFLPALMCLMPWMMTAQYIGVESDQPFILTVNGHRSPVESASYALRVSDTAETEIRVSFGDSLVLNKVVTAKPNEHRRYVVEPNSLGKWAFFYRSGSVDLNTAPYSEWPVVTPVVELARVESELPETEETDAEFGMSPSPVIREAEVDDFESVLEQFTSISFEFERVRKITEWAAEHNPTTGQIRRLAELSSFDPIRMMLLQQVYPHCSEPSGYSGLRSVFQFESTQLQFDQWLHQQQEQE